MKPLDFASALKRAPMSGVRGGAGDFPAEILDPAQAAEIVVQRLIDAGFQIEPAERRGALPKSPLSQLLHIDVASLPRHNLPRTPPLSPN